MSLDTQKLVSLIKKAAIEAVNAKDPVSVKVGTVVSASPLKISINQKITVSASQLLLTNAVRNHALYAQVLLNTEEALSGGSYAHKHECKGVKKFMTEQELKAGEKVLLLRCDGGQKFIVLDRLEAPNG